MCAVLTNFMTATESELKSMNTQQMKLLNVQEQYKKEIKTEVDKILNSVYHMIQEKQTKTFDEVLQTTKASASVMEKSITACSEKAKSAAERVNISVAKLKKANSWQDFLLWVSPAAVLIDVIIRVVQMFGV